MARKTKKIGEDKNHPTLKAVKAALKKNPELSRFFLAQAYSVSFKTISTWEKQGWLKFKEKKRDNKTSTWGKHMVNPIPWDLSMKNVRK